MQIHWNEDSNTFGLAGRAEAFAPGTHVALHTHTVTVDLAGARVVGSGPTGPSVTMSLPFSFKPQAAGHTFRVEVAATDELGHQDGFLGTGEWRILDTRRP